MSDADDAQDGADDAQPGEVLSTETGVITDEDGTPMVVTEKRHKNTAAFAEVADRPKKKAIENDEEKGDVEFYDDLRKFDAELAGTIRAMVQSAGSGLGVTHPAVEGERSEMSDLEEEITTACRDLIDDLNIRQEIETYFRNAVVHGNDISHVQYEEAEADGEGGVSAITPLPLRLLTVVDEPTYQNGFNDPIESYSQNKRDYDTLITSPDYYVLSEDNETARQVFPSHDILHIARNRRGNWHEDRLGRLTYNVWGETTLDPVKYAVQTKQNTLANKVAMDDKLLTREYYRINVEELFGHIDDPDLRQERVEEYATDLRQKLEDLEADQKPIIPEEVDVEIKGPQGESARNMADFIQTMNDSIQHALTYHVASFGRDAGGTSRGNRPAKEMSENTVRQLRDVIKRGFRELFRIHAVLRFEDAREVANPEFDDHRRYELADDVVLPTLTFEPVDPEERNDEVRNAATLYEKGIADQNEARAEADLPPLDEEAAEDRRWHPKKAPQTLEEQQEQLEQENAPPGEGDGEDGPPGDGEGDGENDGPAANPNEEPTESRPSYRTNSSEGARVERTERTERVGGGDDGGEES